MMEHNVQALCAPHEVHVKESVSLFSPVQLMHHTVVLNTDTLKGKKRFTVKLYSLFLRKGYEQEISYLL